MPAAELVAAINGLVAQVLSASARRLTRAKGRLEIYKGSEGLVYRAVKQEHNTL